MALIIDFYRLGLDHPAIDAWFRGIYQSFFAAIEDLGVSVTYSSKEPNRKADVLVIPLGGGQDKSSAQAMQLFSGPIILYAGAASQWFRKGFIERWHDRILFVYGFDHSEFSPQMYGKLGIPYYCLIGASNPNIMQPLGLPRLYDVVFVGNAGSGAGRHKYVEPLMRAARSRRLMFIGPGWERYGFPNQSIAWGSFLNIVYNLAQICINLSNDEEKMGLDKRLDANYRLFDLGMAGCFQISNAPEVVRLYFDKSEVIAVDPPDEWVSAIMYYLDHPEETESFRVAVRKRALSEHTWNHRAKRFINLIETHLPVWRKTHIESPSLKKVARLRDTMLPPYGIREVMAKVKRRMNSIRKRLS